MQQILIDIKLNQLLVQCADIVKKGKISIINKDEEVILEHPVNNTNYINIDLKLPGGYYHLELNEDGKITKRNFKL